MHAFGPWVLSPALRRTTVSTVHTGLDRSAPGPVRLVHRIEADHHDLGELLGAVLDAARGREGEGWLAVRGHHRHDGALLLSMEYRGGWPFDDLQERTTFPPGAAAWLALTLAHTLRDERARAGAPRDVNLASSVIGPDGVLMLEAVDLEELERSLPRARTQLRPGLEWMSPEELRGERRSAATDAHRIALVLHTALTGKNPFRDATDLETVRRIISGEWDQAPRADPPLRRLLVGLLEQGRRPGAPELTSLTARLQALARPPTPPELRAFFVGEPAEAMVDELERHRAVFAAEALVLAAPGDAARWAVLADALQDRGSPRGEWLALRQRSADARRLEELSDAHPWLEPHFPVHGQLRWLGARAQLAVSTPPDLSHLALRTLRSLELRVPWSGETVAEDLGPTLPPCLERLVLRATPSPAAAAALERQCPGLSIVVQDPPAP